MYVNVKENMKLEFFYSIDAFQYSKKEKKNLLAGASVHESIKFIFIIIYDRTIYKFHNLNRS